MNLHDVKNLKAYIYFHYELPNGKHMSEKAVVNRPVLTISNCPRRIPELEFSGPLMSWTDQNGKQEKLLAFEAAREIESPSQRMMKNGSYVALGFMNGLISYTPKYSPIKRVIFNDPVTVVIWTDDTKTIVRCQDGEPYDPEKGLAMCMAKKMLGNKGNYYDIFHKYLDDYKEDEVMKKKLAKAVKKKAKKGKKK